MSRRKRKRQIQKLHGYSISTFQAHDLFCYQARYIAAGLRTFLRMNRHGIPGSIYTYFCKRNGAEETHRKAEDQASRYWDCILQRMYFAFDQIANDYPDSPYNLWFQSAHEDFQKVHLPFFEKGTKNPDGTISAGKCNFPDAPEDVRKATGRYHLKIRKGCRLYGKYFEDLWD